MSDSHVLNGAELLLECLLRAGVRNIFGMPGSHCVAVYDALQRYSSQPKGGESFRHILCRNEQAGAFMADGYARATGEVGVLLTTAGPGATNAATGIAEAFADGIPLLLVSGQVDSQHVHQECGAFHEMDLQSFFQPITKWNVLVRRIEELPLALSQAFQHLCTPRFRPVQISVPQDLWMARAHRQLLNKFLPPPSPVETARTGSPGSMQQALQLLRQARAPLLFAGGGVISANACRELAELAEKIHAPVITTTMGKGAIPESNPWSLGHARSLPAQQALRRADTMLAVGCRFSEVVTNRWTMPVPRRLIQVDIAPEQIGVNYRVEVGIVGDARKVLQGLLREVAPVERNFWDEELPTIQRLRPAPRHWLISVMRELLPAETIIMSDTCEMGHAMLTDFAVEFPRTFNYPANFIALGWGLPAAIGAKVGAPEWPVACITGDGGFLMTAQELATLVRYNLPVIVVLHNDNSYGAMKRIMQNRYASRFFEVDLNNPDFVAFARSFGVSAYRAESEASFRAALKNALHLQAPCLIEVKTEWEDWRES